MKQLIVDCSKPIGHPEREKFRDLPKSDIAYINSMKKEAEALNQPVIP